jgi:phytoene synthase
MATWALYAFFRVPDEIVDNMPQNTPGEIAHVKDEIHRFRDKWHKAFDKGTSDDPVLRVTSYVFATYKIPFEYSNAFLDAMITDLEKTEYASYEELEQYMYGSAACVGLMMSSVIGFVDEAQRETGLKHAAQLGYAMQLTNFLRDIEEDYVQRKRVYMPQDELAQFGLSTRSIAEKNFDEDFKRFVMWQSERATKLYAEAAIGIPMLNNYGRFPVACASSLYSAILTKLAQQNHNPFAGRARTNKAEKIALAWQAKQGLKR